MLCFGVHFQGYSPNEPPTRPDVLTLTPQVVVSVASGPLSSAPASAARSVEVTVYAVDQAFLDLLPYDLPKPQQDMVLRLSAQVNAYSVNEYRLAPGAVRAVYDKLMSR